MRSSLVTAMLMAAAIASSCSAPQGRPPPSTIPAEKSTCAELVVIDRSDLTLVDRVLVPYSRTVLGVEAEYEDDRGRTLLLVSGGYLDDIIEPYDSLEPSGNLELAGAPADVLVGTFFETPITVAYRFRGEPPCGTVAAVGLGFTVDEFATVLPDLAIKES